MKELSSLIDFETERKEKLKGWGLDEESIAKNKLLIAEVTPEVAKEKGKELVSFIASKKFTDSPTDLDKVINLIKEGADLSYQTEKGNNSLLVCARKGYTSTFITLLKFGADINIVNKNQTTCIMSSARHGHETILLISIYMGGDVNARDFTGESAIIMAKRHGMSNTYNILAKNGAYLDIKNLCNLTSYDYKNIDGGAEVDDRKYYATNSQTIIRETTHEDVMDLINDAKDKLKAIMSDIPDIETPDVETPNSEPEENTESNGNISFENIDLPESLKQGNINLNFKVR